MLDTLPHKLKALSLETLEAYHHYLSEVPQTGLFSTRDQLQTCADRVALLGSEIELRRAEATNFSDIERASIWPNSPLRLATKREIGQRLERGLR